MALARFHSLRGEKRGAALILVKLNPFTFSSTPVYVAATTVAYFAGVGSPELIPEGFDFPIDDKHCNIVDFVVDGEVRKTKEGVILKTIM